MTGQVLAKASDVDYDTEWIDVGSGSTPISAYFGNPMMMKPGNNQYIGNILTGSLTTSTFAANRMEIAPFLAGYNFSINQAGISISTAAAGSACIVIFAADENGRPTTLLAQSENIDTGSTGTKFASISQSFTAGTLYYIGVWTSAAPTFRCAQPYSCYAMTWSTASTPVRRAVLRRTETWGGTASNWTYDVSQHAEASVTLVLMQVSG